MDLAKAQQANEAKFDKSIHKLGTFEKGLGGLQKSIAGFAAGAGVFSVLASGMASFTKEMQYASQSNRKLQDDITAFLALGQNIKNSKGLTRDILNLSSATGLDPKQIADMKFALQSSAGGLSKEIQDAIEKESIDLNKLTASPLDTNLRLLVKGMGQFGDEVESATELANKFNLAAEQGDMTFGLLASRFPEVGAAAKAVGGSLDEILGHLVGLTRVEGDADKALTSYRNIVLSLEDAMNKGLIPASSTLTEKLQQIGGMNTENLLAIFGKENLAAAKNMASALTDAADATDRISKVDVANIEKLLEHRLLNDPNYRASEDAKMVEKYTQNNDLSSPNLAKRSNWATRDTVEMDRARDSMHPFWKDVWGAQRGKWALDHVIGGYAKMFGSDMGGREITDMEIKQLQQDAGTSPEDIALKRAIRRDKEARAARGLPTMEEAKASRMAGESATDPANPDFDPHLQAAIRGGYQKRYLNRPGARPPKITEGPAGTPFSQAGFDYERQLERAGYGVGKARGRGTHDPQSNRAAALGDIHLHISQMNVSGSAQEFRDLAAQSARTPRTG